MAEDLFIISHVYNESTLMLPLWLQHHSKLTDKLVILDYHSTDGLEECIKTWAPSAQIIRSKYDYFGAAENTRECMDLERTLPKQAAKITLNATEFLFSDPRPHIAAAKGSEQFTALGIRSFIMVDPHELEVSHPIYKDHHYGFLDPGHIRRRRFLHWAEDGQYHIGRHGTNLPAQMVDDLYLLWYGYSPWPQCKQRKLQIQTQIPEKDKVARLGWEHLITEAQLEAKYREFAAQSGNLLENEYFKTQWEKFTK